MKIAYILFDGITLLDFFGFYDPIKNIKTLNYLNNLDWDLCAMKNSIKDSYGLEITVDKVSPDLSAYDMVFVPGGYGTRQLQFDEKFIEWIKTAKNVKYKVSVCTGSLILGAAGFLNSKSATINFNEYEALKNYCPNVLKNRIVDDSNTITAGAVASSIDLGLYICEKLIGKEKTKKISKGMDYHPGDFEIIKLNT
ncbi:DJ-1/PfpI family protein [Fulvivirga sp. RKSG066]|uniref:DJ-1/PfpI family protein n=1 Tax=Fulvivirga aurantia TaxID=2529383 RepID=UPI0012BC9BBB|nr:DJ-1/PfpI family protein [Fulvivirga aurantia]MTI20068.1 DJ-1/PfpI family protein [Fulvivirga aurantia]